MLLLSSAQSRELERIAISEVGISEDALMESAGQTVAVAMEREWGDLRGRQIAILCGKGRNGADGMVAARHLLNEGVRVGIIIAASETDLSEPCRRQAEILRKLGLQLSYVNDQAGLPLATALFKSADIIVDALYGTGFKDAVTGLPAALLISMNAAGKPVVSVDLPSGIDADSGAVRGACAYAKLSVSFTLPKLGLALQPAKSFTGKLIVADIGIPLVLLGRMKGPFVELAEAAAMRALVPHRALMAHKKNSGTLLIVAGSIEYPGAAQLCVTAAIASGAATIHLLVPQALRQQMQAAIPEALVHEQSLENALELAKNSHAVVLGPGLGRTNEAIALARRLYESIEKPMLVDADALFAVAQAGPLKAAGPRLLTPHDGEFSRLIGGPEGLEKDRIAALRSYVKASACTVLLKGPSSLVATENGRLNVNTTGNPALATAGSGDVLSGIAGAFLAQGLGCFDAARLAAYVHGLAADLWLEEDGPIGLSASKLIGFLARTFSHMRGKA